MTVDVHLKKQRVGQIVLMILICMDSIFSFFISSQRHLTRCEEENHPSITILSVILSVVWNKVLF